MLHYNYSEVLEGNFCITQLAIAYNLKLIECIQYSKYNTIYRVLEDHYIMISISYDFEVDTLHTVLNMQL